MKATVLIPTSDHRPTLRLAVRSALQQTVQELEVFLIGAGVSEAGRAVVEELTEADSRVRFFEFPGHERHGEPYWHDALQEAKGEIVCYLTDHDLWLPEHVERLHDVLQSVDFANALSFHLLPDGEVLYFPMDLRHLVFRGLILNGKNGIAFSCAAHTLDLYRRLPHGWQTTPPGKSTELHMFQQILSVPDVRSLSCHFPTALVFPGEPRFGWSDEQKVEELTRWQEKMATDAQRIELRLELMELGLQDRDQWIANLLMDKFRQPMNEPPPPTFSTSQVSSAPGVSHLGGVPTPSPQSEPEPQATESTEQPDPIEPPSADPEPASPEPETPASPEPAPLPDEPEPKEEAPEPTKATSSSDDPFWSQEELVDDLALINADNEPPNTPTWEPGPADDIYTAMPSVMPIVNFSDPVPLPKPAPVKNGSNVRKPPVELSAEEEDRLRTLKLEELLPMHKDSAVKKPNPHPAADHPSWHLPGMTKDEQSITSDWQMVEQTLIDGVVAKQVRNVPTGYGHLCEAYRIDWDLDSRAVGQVYYSVLEPGAISGWHVHGKTTNRLSVAQGQMLIVLYDARTDSPTHGTINQFRIGTVRPGVIVIPPGVWYAGQNTVAASSLLLNIVDHAYQYDDPDHYRLPLDTDQIPYRFEAVN